MRTTRRAALGVMVIVCMLSGCEEERQNSDKVQQAAQETLLAEGTSQVGMPAIKNFRERKLLKDILELRDQTGLVTYTYIENAFPAIVRGHTALGGKLTFLGESIGYPIPYSTQFTNPEKLERRYSGGDWYALPQADPNGLFSPASAEGTWVLLSRDGKVRPAYIEPRLVCLQDKLPED